METKTLKIEKILLDTKNPRLKEIYEHQKDALKELLDISNEKIYNLIIDISSRGLNPFENIGVLEVEGKYVVVEGNRRVTALKILNNTALIKDIAPKLYDKVKDLKTDIKSIDVVVFSDRSEANKWIELIHTGENKGKGRVNWSSENKKLFISRNNDTLTPIQQFLNEFNKKSNLNDELLEKLGNVKITNLERLFDDPDVKEVLGVEKINKNNLNFDKFNSEIADKMMLDLITRTPPVKEIYSKKDRQEYMEKILNTTIPEDYKNLNKDTIRQDIFSISTTENSNSKDKEQKKVDSQNEDFYKKSNPHTNTRNSLIPKHVTLKITNPKINNLYRELKSCKLSDFPTLIECSFRIFFELSLDEYLKNYGINLSKPTLKNKFNECLKHLNTINCLTIADYKTLQVVGENNYPCATNYQHSLIHSSLSLTVEDLKKLWDNYQIFFQAIFSQLEKKMANKHKLC